MRSEKPHRFLVNASGVGFGVWGGTKAMEGLEE